MIGYFSSFSAFFHMGGYAAYVWPAYALVMLTLCVNGLLASMRLRRLLRHLKCKKIESEDEQEAQTANL